MAWRVVSGTGESIRVCMACWATWGEGDAFVAASAVHVIERLDARGMQVDPDQLHAPDDPDPPPLPGTRTMSNRSRKRRKVR